MNQLLGYDKLAADLEKDELRLWQLVYSAVVTSKGIDPELVAEEAVKAQRKFIRKQQRKAV